MHACHVDEAKTTMDLDPSTSAQWRHDEVTGQTNWGSAEQQAYDGLLRAASELSDSEDYHGAATRLREAIRLLPAQPAAYSSLGEVLTASGDGEGACESCLLAERCYSQHDAGWADALASAFIALLRCPTYPRPSWWLDAELLPLSEEALAVGDQEWPLLWHMRAYLLNGDYDDEQLKPLRTSAQHHESARCYMRAAEIFEGFGASESAQAMQSNAARAVQLTREKLMTEEIAGLGLS